MAKNKNLKEAKKNKNDEFYTRLEDIENEISMHSDYKKHFKNKVVLCNCDDPEFSNFWIFFKNQFRNFKLKKLITTHYEPGGQSYKLEWSGETLPDGTTVNVIKTPLKGDGDFRSEECIELLKEADIVVTNPMFSLFREYVAQLMEYNKKFVIIGNINAVTYKEFFPLIKENKVWAGYSFNKTMDFIMPDSYELKGKGYVDEKGRKHGFVPGVAWYTNLQIDKRTEELPLNCNYKGNEDRYPHYDNYDAINVDKVKDIPKDYMGVMGVPITFLDSYCPEQFEIVGLAPERLKENESSLQLKRYKNAVQYKDDNTTCSGNKVNDGPVIIHDNKPNRFPFYTSETVPNKYLEVLYARILIRSK